MATCAPKWWLRGLKIVLCNFAHVLKKLYTAVYIPLKEHLKQGHSIPDLSIKDNSPGPNTEPRLYDFTVGHTC